MGIMLYELLMGSLYILWANDLASRRLFPSGDTSESAKEQPNIPRDLEAICRKCLENDLAHRYRNGGELVADLTCFLQGEPVPHHQRFWRPFATAHQTISDPIVTLACLTILGVGYLALEDYLRRHPSFRK